MTDTKENLNMFSTFLGGSRDRGLDEIVNPLSNAD